ncbi:MAG: hypothetical protein ACLTDR_04995 [Adlercreutzia equolifaciens]
MREGRHRGLRRRGRHGAPVHRRSRHRPQGGGGPSGAGAPLHRVLPLPGQHLHRQALPVLGERERVGGRGSGPVPRTSPPPRSSTSPSWARILAAWRRPAWRPSAGTR